MERSNLLDDLIWLQSAPVADEEISMSDLDDECMIESGGCAFDTGEE